MPLPKNRVSLLKPPLTLSIDARAKEMKADGENVIIFGAGEPDFKTPESVVKSAQQAAAMSTAHHYSSVTGLTDLKNVIATRTNKRLTGVDYNGSDIVVTNGGKQAIYEYFQAVLAEDDEVIIPAPYWTTYPECVRLAGARPIHIVGSQTQNFKVTVDQLREATTKKTRAIAIVSPGNPAGSVYSAKEMGSIGEWALENNILVLSDEIYENLVYDDINYKPILAVVPELAENVTIVNGVSKSYAMTGWRLGWVASKNKEIISRIGALQGHLTSNVANVSQLAALTALSEDESFINGMHETFTRRRQLIFDEMKTIQGFTVTRPDGAFYVYPNVTKLLKQKIGDATPQNTLELANLILEQVGVACIPGEAFGTPGYLRFSYALGEADIKEGMARLRNLFGSSG